MRFKTCACLCSNRLDGYSGSDLKELCRAAASRPFRELAARMRATAAAGGGGGECAEEKLRPLRASDFAAAAELARLLLLFPAPRSSNESPIFKPHTARLITVSRTKNKA